MKTILDFIFDMPPPVYFSVAAVVFFATIEIMSAHNRRIRSAKVASKEREFNYEQISTAALAFAVAWPMFVPLGAFVAFVFWYVGWRRG